MIQSPSKERAKTGSIKTRSGPALPVSRVDQRGHSSLSESPSEKDAEVQSIQVFPIFDRNGDVARVIQSGTRDAGVAATSPVKRTARPRTDQTVSEPQGFYGMIGSGLKMEGLFRMIRVVANSDATILILGESGTGKERVARAIHRHSLRRQRPFIAIDCGAFSETLLESELFGHIRGSFTGAIQNKKGLLQEAHEGTLFLDEIGDSSPAFQSKLLRVLQEGEVRPVGGTRNCSIDVRVIAATNKPLHDAVRMKAFREDLYYRLAVIPIEIPPLREHREDIRPLAEHFVTEYAAKNRRGRIFLSTTVLDRLTAHSWPGNVRELENVIERAVVVSQGPEIQVEELFLSGHLEAVPAVIRSEESQGRENLLSLMERERIVDALRRHGGNRSKSARELGISRTGLYYKMKRYQIAPPY
jgi:two-component system response regulator AtoC